MLSRRGLVAGLFAAALVVVSVLLLDGHAAAAPSDPATDTTPVYTIDASWGGQTTHLAWNGKQYTTVETTFVGDRVISPGDKVQRTMDIVNNGPTPAVITLSLIVHQGVPPQAPNPSLSKDVSLFWNVAGTTGQAKFYDLLAAPDGSTAVTTDVRVAQGATAPVTVGFSVSPTLMVDQGGGNSTALTFDVLIQMEEDLNPPEPTPTPPTSPPPTTPPPSTPPPTTPPPTAPSSPTPQPPWFFPTGGSVLGGSSLLVVLLIGSAVALAFVPVKRRHKDPTADRRAA